MGFLEEQDFANVPTIPEFYKGKTILVTGGTGFMGKVLIEKLLYSCTDLDRIYLLMRSKKGVKSEDRLAALFSTMYVFDRLKRERPGVFESKVHVVAGDVLETGLGLSEEDRTLLVNRVNIIFHVAASVRFDDTLTFASKMNLKGTKEIVDLAKEIRELNALVHVSTSYSNTNRNPVDEVMYPPHADWRDTLKVCENIDEHTLRIVTPKYLGELPNTYVFTKQLAEHVIYEQKGQLPAVIIRPSIVIASVTDPMPGWIENFNGPVGILVACGKGIMRSLYSDPSLIADYIPVDVCIKHIISAAWARGTKPLEASDDVEIYNCCAGELNNITMGDLVETGKKMAADVPLNDMLWNVGGSITTSKTIHYIKIILGPTSETASQVSLEGIWWRRICVSWELVIAGRKWSRIGQDCVLLCWRPKLFLCCGAKAVILLHLIPAMLVDLILWILGKKTMLVKLQRRIYIANLALRYYVTKQWNFANQNFVLLRSRIKNEDREQFYYEVENVDKYQYFKQCVIGGRKYLLNEKDEDLPKARAHYRKIVFMDKLVNCFFYGFIFWLFVNNSYVQHLVVCFKELF